MKYRLTFLSSSFKESRIIECENYICCKYGIKIKQGGQWTHIRDIFYDYDERKYRHFIVSYLG